MDIGLASNDEELNEALALLLERPELTEAQLARQVDVLRKNASKYRIRLDQCVVARRAQHVVAACLPVDSSGRTTSLFLPGQHHLPGISDEMVPVIAEIAQQARQRNIQLLQAIISTDAEHEPAILERSGFSQLARLIYLELDPVRPISPDQQPPMLEWKTYSEQTHDVFCNVLQSTYEGSLDCVSLNGQRDIEDILASHRDTGVFDPSRWLMGYVDDQPVGVVLLAETIDHTGWDVVYIGLVPSQRGKGYATSLMFEAIKHAREHAALQLTITVDERNTPARALYERFGAVERFRRDAWVCMLD